MKLFGQHGVLSHPRRAKERQKYISSSLASSSQLSSRLLNSSNDPSRALLMNFHKDWLHPNCPVQKWYQQQQAERSSTRFTSIEHWKENEAPFFHEYLLIRLGDQGQDVCRVERMGDGSGGSRHAISRKGCAAHDIIQWLPTSDSMSNLSATMVCRVEFPESFDIVDVLAICWSIQQTQRCSVYTLQRYNCYFLCLSILAVLARRVGAWEKVVESKDSWPTLVGDVIDYLEQTECQDADEYMALEVPKLLEPEHPNPRKFVLDALRNHLVAQGLDGWRAAMSVTLWAKDTESAIRESLDDVIEAATEESLDGEDTCATQMKHLFGNEVEDVTHEILTEHNIPLEFAQGVYTSAIEGLSTTILGAMKSQMLMHGMRAIEYQPALWCRALSWAGAPLAYGCAFLWPLVAPAEDLEDAMMKSALRRVVMGNPLNSMSFCRIGLLVLLSKDYLNEDLVRLYHELQLAEALMAQKILQSSICPSRDTKFRAMQILYNTNTWILDHQSCVCRAINRVTEARIVAIESSSKDYLLRMTNSDGEVQELTPRQFHDNYVHVRIRKHAERVGSMGLAAAPLMEMDIHAVMGNIWKGLPMGHGGLFSPVNEVET